MRESPGRTPPWAKLYLERREYRKAKESFRRSLESDPDSFVARLGYANALRRTEGLSGISRAVQ